MTEETYGMAKIEDCKEEDVVVVGNNYFVLGPKYQLVSQNQPFDIKIVGADSFFVFYYADFPFEVGKWVYTNMTDMLAYSPAVFRYPAPICLDLRFSYFCKGNVVVDYALGGMGKVYTERKKVRVAENSGPDWVDRFPKHTDVQSLNPNFQAKVARFVAAMKAGGLSVSISCTYRSVECSFLMHYAWRIAHPNDAKGRGIDPRGADMHVGEIYIGWARYDDGGNYLPDQSVISAVDMVSKWGMADYAALRSKHNTGDAIDMSISWNGTPTIEDASGKKITLDGAPKDGTNEKLQAVGATYGVFKLAGDDYPHWQSS